MPYSTRASSFNPNIFAALFNASDFLSNASLRASLARCHLALLVTIFVLATKTDVQPNFVSGGHLFALDQKNEREDKISCAFHANGS